METGDRHVAHRLFGRPWERLHEGERRLLERALARHPAPPAPEADSAGARLADRVAAFGGSWTFIGLFAALLGLWVLGNTLVAARAVDPYPFVFLNLILSMLAALQAPIIMMSQNRQAEKDRAAARHDYEVNLRAEIGILQLHDKLDAMRSEIVEERLARIEALLRG